MSSQNKSGCQSSSACGCSRPHSAAITDGVRRTYDGPLTLARDLMVINVTKESIKVRMAVVDEYVLPPDVTPAYKTAPRTDEKSPSAKVEAGKWKGYTPPPMPKKLLKLAEVRW